MASSLHDDAKKIHRVIPKWEMDDIRRTLTTYENHANRTELAVKKYIRHFDQGLTKEKCVADAKEIHQIFPQHSFANIITIVTLLGREVNRVRVTIRLLLRESYKRDYEEKNTTEQDSQSTISNHNSDSLETLNSADSTNNLTSSENELSKKCNDAIDAFDKSDMNDSLNSFNNVMNEADLLIAKFDLDSLNSSLPKDTQRPNLDVPKIPQLNALSLNVCADHNKPSTSTAKEQLKPLKLPKAPVSFHIAASSSPSTNSNTCRDIKVVPPKWLETRQDSPSTSNTTNLPEKERDFFKRHLRDFFDNSVAGTLEKMSKEDLAAAKKIAETDFSKVTNIAQTTVKRRSQEKSVDSEAGKRKKIRWDNPVIDLDTQPLVPTTSNEVIEINDTMDITLPFDQEGNDSNSSIKDFFDSLDALAHENDEFPPLEEFSHEEASAPIDYKLFTPLMNIFPNACPTFLKNLCGGKVNDRGVLDELINTILEMDDYPKRNVAKSPEVVLDVEEQWEIMKQVLPDADPCYLKKNIENLINEPEKLKQFIDNAMEMGNYPTMKEYLRKQQLSAQTRQYTTEFSVEKFVESIPDPKSYFKDKPALMITGQNKDYLQSVLKNHYDMLKVATMHSAFTEKSVTAIFKKLGFLAKCKTNHMKSKRKAGQIYDAIQDIPFLQEIAYNLHRKEIELYMKEQETRAQEERLQAKKDGLLKTCACCYDDEVMPKDIVTCEKNGCMFCKSCVQRSTEVAFGDGRLEFPCLADCGSKFNLQMLKNALTPKLFSRLAQKKQLEEVKSAGLEDLEMCPFCDFATIPATGDKLFRCLNAECMKESCRECKEPSHIPLRCDEVEKDEAVKARTYIEDKMTEALLRKCWKCGIKFIKSDGCNKMTCSCGAHMCYVCNKPVKDYKHFNGQGGDRFDLCPLYSDTNKLHEEAVMKSGIEAKKEIADPTKLLVDPTADIQKHYQEYKAKNPVNLPFGMQENPVVQQQQQQQQQQDLLLQVQEERRPPPPPGGPYYRGQVERGNPRGRADHRDRDRHNRRDNLRDQARRYDIDNRQMAPPPLPPHNQLPQPPPPPPLRPYHHHNHHNGLRPPVLNHVRLPPNHPANLRNYERHQPHQLHPPWFPDEDRRY